jgi:uncharacterized protein with PIN domain
VAARFLADGMLGRLGRWLRILGIDCADAGEVSDAELLRRAAREERTILSRDRALPGGAVHLVASEELREQLREVLRAFALEGELRPFTRCSRCNEPLRAAAEEEVVARVPPRVLARQSAFYECPACRRVYWEGSHTERMRRVVAELRGPEGEG